jgi:ketosteroid isomerase-like protein
MSRENVEIAKRWIELSNARDLSAILNILDPDIECFPREGEPEATAFRGREAYAKRAQDALASFDAYQIDVSECIDLGEYVVVVGQISARGRVSGVPVSDEEVWLLRFKDGKCLEYRECGTKANALEAAAAGLRG